MRKYWFWFIKESCPLNGKNKKLRDLTVFKKGEGRQEDEDNRGDYAFFTTLPLVKRTNKYFFDQEALLMSLVNNGYVEYFRGKFSALRQVYVLSVESKIIYWLLESIDDLLHEREVDVRNATFFVPSDNLLILFNQLVRPIQLKIDNLINQMDILKSTKEALIEEIYSQNIEINGI